MCGTGWRTPAGSSKVFHALPEELVVGTEGGNSGACLASAAMGMASSAGWELNAADGSFWRDAEIDRDFGV